jgi:hypothetical protein
LSLLDIIIIIMRRQSTSSPQQQRKQNGSNNNKKQPPQPPQNLAAFNQLVELNRNVAVVASFLREQAKVLGLPTSSETSKGDAISNLRKAADCLDNIISNGDQAIASLGTNYYCTTTNVATLSYAQRRIQTHKNDVQIRGDDERGTWAKSATESKFKRVFSEISGPKQQQQFEDATSSSQTTIEPVAKAARTDDDSDTEVEDDDDDRDEDKDDKATAHELLKCAPVKFSIPANRKRYTVREVIPQLLAVENRKIRLQMWRYLVSKGMVPDLVGRTLRRFFVMARKGQLDLDRPWKLDCGRKPILTVDEINQIAEAMPDIGSYDENKVKQIIIEHQKKRNSVTGIHAPIRNPDRTTVRNYKDMFASIKPRTKKDDDDNDNDNESTASEASGALDAISVEKLRKFLKDAPVNFTPPADWKGYTVREAIPQLIDIHNNHQRMKQWRYLRSNHLVPDDIPLRSFRRVLKQARQGTLDLNRPWRKCEPSRRTRLTREDLKAIIKERRDVVGGEPISDPEFKDMLQLAERQKVEIEVGAAAVDPDLMSPLDDRTIRTYRAMYASVLAEEGAKENTIEASTTTHPPDSAPLAPLVPIHDIQASTTHPPDNAPLAPLVPIHEAAKCIRPI